MINLFPVAEASISNVSDVLDLGTSLLSTGVVPFLVGLAVAAFVYGIIEYFLNPNNEEKRKNGKSFMLWGVIALFVMVSFWGIVGILQNTFETSDNTSQVKIPQMPDTD